MINGRPQNKENNVKAILDTIDEVKEDSAIPKNVRIKLENVQSILTGTKEVSMQVNRCLDELEQVSTDANLQPYTRTQIWNIVTMLESL